MNIEELLEELNDSDVNAEMAALDETMRCLDGVETVEDFRVNLDNAIEETEALLKSLRALKR